MPPTRPTYRMRETARLLCVVGLVFPVYSRLVNISNTLPRFDVDGDYVDAHDGLVVAVNGTYYLYGEAYQNQTLATPYPWADTPQLGVYTSPDLLTWTYRGNPLPDSVLTGTKWIPNVWFDGMMCFAMSGVTRFEVHVSCRQNRRSGSSCGWVQGRGIRRHLRTGYPLHLSTSALARASDPPSGRMALGCSSTTTGQGGCARLNLGIQLTIATSPLTLPPPIHYSYVVFAVGGQVRPPPCPYCQRRPLTATRQLHPPPPVSSRARG